MGRKIIGLDTCVFIYLMEDHPRYASACERLLEQVQYKDRAAIFSIIGMIELLTGPKLKKDFKMVKMYRDLLVHHPHLDIYDINEATVESASDLRAVYKLSTPDAIHLATAVSRGAKEFWTNDRKLKKVKEIRVRLLSEL
jgi:predicted nucleic acid-binding protein